MKLFYRFSLQILTFSVISALEEAILEPASLDISPSVDWTVLFYGLCLLHGVERWRWIQWKGGSAFGMLWNTASFKLGMVTNLF